MRGCAAYTGGLGDVMGALPKALARRGHRTMVVVPRYSSYEEGWETGVRIRLRVCGSDVEARECCCQIWHHLNHPCSTHSLPITPFLASAAPTWRRTNAAA